MRESNGRVRIGTEKIMGFPHPPIIFGHVRRPDSFVDGGPGSEAGLRIFGLARC